MARKLSLASPAGPTQTSITVADNASASHNQTGCGLLLVCGVGDSSGYLVEGTAGLRDWQTIPD